MATFEPVRIPHGWHLEVGAAGTAAQAVVLDVVSPRLDRGALRATLTVTASESLLWRDTVNLTSARSRARVLRILADKGTTLDERTLIALDEACRRANPR